MRRRRTESFLLRIVVHEEGCSQADELRGRVQHIGTGVEHAFTDLEELMRFLHSHMLPVEDSMLMVENPAHSPAT